MSAMANNLASRYFRIWDVDLAVGSASSHSQAYRWIRECTESHVNFPRTLLASNHPMQMEMLDSLLQTDWGRGVQRQATAGVPGNPRH